jgi:hypothetical protein
LVEHAKTGENVPNYHKINDKAVKYGH